MRVAILLLAAGCAFEPPSSGPRGSDATILDSDVEMDASVADAEIDAGAAICGDGIIESPESCDDGAGTEAGCRDDCVVLPGWRCQGGPSVCNTVCGDGL